MYIAEIAHSYSPGDPSPVFNNKGKDGAFTWVSQAERSLRQREEQTTLILISWGWGGPTSTSSMTSSSPAPHATAASPENQNKHRHGRVNQPVPIRIFVYGHSWNPMRCEKGCRNSIPLQEMTFAVEEGGIVPHWHSWSGLARFKDGTRIEIEEEAQKNWCFALQ